MPTRKHWLDVSARMFQQLLPPDPHHGHADGAEVDAALAAMALARGPEQLPALIATLEPATLAAIRQRWQHYAAGWPDVDAERFPWIPPQKPDVWRAVLVALIGADDCAHRTRRRLWPEQFGDG